MEEKTEKLNRFDKCRIALEKGITCNPETGLIFGVRGNQLTRIDKDGYINFSFKYNKKYYYLFGHQFIYYYVNGEYDINLDIDHINTIKNDNRIENLRTATRSENKQNVKHRGIYWHKKNKKWIARIRINYKYINLGSFNTEEEALIAREAGKLKYHTH